MTKTYTILHESGLQARPAHLLVQQAAKFNNSITVTFKEDTLPLDSIMAVLSLGVPKHSVIKITVEGDQQEKVFVALEKVLVENRLI